MLAAARAAIEEPVRTVIASKVEAVASRRSSGVVPSMLASFTIIVTAAVYPRAASRETRGRHAATRTMSAQKIEKRSASVVAGAEAGPGTLALGD